MASLSWYFHRLRSMSLPEMGFRAQQFLQKQREQRTQIGLNPKFSLPALPAPLLPIGETDIELEGTTLDIFGIPFDYSQPINWHLDIASQREFPKAFAKNINIRTEEYGSAKHVWEVNRLQFLPIIALRYRQTKDERFLTQLRDHITHWVQENPYLLGVNWYSNIEVNIRLIVWFFCWEIIEASQLAEQSDFGTFIRDTWLPTIYLHCRYSYENPSKFSSANNHLISEHAGLFVAANYWSFEESSHWAAHARKGLEAEIIVQHSPRGVNKEEAAEYIQFITDFFLIPYVVAERCQRPFSQRYRQQLESVLDYIFQLMDTRGNVPFYGDEDDGKVVFFDSPPPDNFHSLLSSGVVLFQRTDWKQQAVGIDNKNAVLFGEAGQAIFQQVKADTTALTSRFYAEEGHFILRATPQANLETYVHFDAAPLGFLSIAAHGHADALSFVMHVDGQPIITDVGTYTYHTEADWRSYFISTLAHNTICVDGQDQAKSTGPTMWVQHYAVRVLNHETTDAQDRVVAEHNGYQSIGVMHRREITLDKATETLRIIDHIALSQPGEHTLEMPLHLHPEVAVAPASAGTWALTAHGARPVIVKPDSAWQVSIVSGQTDPILGWYSESFQKKRATHVLLGQLQINQDVTLVTEITVGQPDQQ